MEFFLEDIVRIPELNNQDSMARVFFGLEAYRSESPIV